MKKQLIVIGIAVILTFIGLSGCNSTEQTNEQKQTPEDLIIGKWYYAIEDAYFTFYKNRSICMNIANENFWGRIRNKQNPAYIHNLDNRYNYNLQIFFYR